MEIQPHIAWQRVGDDVVLVDLQTGDALGLNPTASFIWTRLDGLSEEQIAAEMAESFLVCPAAARDDVREFVQMLVQREFVQEKAPTR